MDQYLEDTSRRPSILLILLFENQQLREQGLEAMFQQNCEVRRGAFVNDVGMACLRMERGEQRGLIGHDWHCQISDNILQGSCSVRWRLVRRGIRFRLCRSQAELSLIRRDNQQGTR